MIILLMVFSWFAVYLLCDFNLETVSTFFLTPNKIQMMYPNRIYFRYLLHIVTTGQFLTSFLVYCFPRFITVIRYRYFHLIGLPSLNHAFMVSAIATAKTRLSSGTQDATPQFRQERTTFMCKRCFRCFLHIVPICYSVVSALYLLRLS